MTSSWYDHIIGRSVLKTNRVVDIPVWPTPANAR